MASSFRRNKKITIQYDANAATPIETQDWKTLCTAWASKEPILGNEFYAAEQAQSDVKIKFRTDYISTVTDFMRIVHGSETYDIRSAINVKSQNKELLMYCSEV